MTDVTESPKPHIELWDIDRVKPYAGNAKLHPVSQVKTLADAILRFGWDQPIVVEPDGTIIKGHGRRMAALDLVSRGIDRFRKVPVWVRHDLTKEEADAARLSDNRVTSTEYDTNLLQEELRRLAGIEVDLSNIGFTAKELDFLSVDLGSFDDSKLATDIGAAVNRQREDNAERVREIDAGKVSLGEAFGFKSVTPVTARRLRRFLADQEERFGAEGADALDAFLTAYEEKAA